MFVAIIQFFAGWVVAATLLMVGWNLAKASARESIPAPERYREVTDLRDRR